MFSFKKSKGRGKSSAGSAKEGTALERGAIQLLPMDESNDRALAFNLQWRSVVTAGGDVEAIRVARAAKANHYTVVGSSTGFGKVLGKPATWPSKIYSASAVAAHYYGGSTLILLEIDKDSREYWVAVSVHGQPSTVDSFWAGASLSEVIAAAQRQIEAHAEDGVSLQVYSNIEGLTELGEVKHCNLLDLAGAAQGQETLVKRVPAAGPSLPKPMIYAIGGLVVVGIGVKGYQMLEAKRRAEAAAANVIVEEDPSVAWTRVIDEWRAGRAAPDGNGLQSVRQSLDAVPAAWYGWILARTVCQANPIAVGQATQAWACTATYQRTPGARLTREMKPLIPQGWSVAFTPLNQMQASWTVSQAATQIDLSKIGPADGHLIETVSRLQRLQPGLSMEPSFAFVPVEIVAPKRSDGTSVGQDQRVEGLKQATLNLRGPLRSIDAVAAEGIPVTWTAITISYEPTSTKPGLTSSAVMADAQGLLYAKN